MRDRANALSPQCVGETVARIISSILFQFQLSDAVATTYCLSVMLSR